MNQSALWALAATMGTWLLTALGAASVFLIGAPTIRKLNIFLGFSAGVMIAASFWSLLQPAIEGAEAYSRAPAWFVATTGFLAGVMFLVVCDRTVSAAIVQLDSQPPTGTARRVAMLVLSVTLHNIPEGLAVGVAFGALENNFSQEALLAAVSVAVGIGLQNFPEGAAVSLPLLREGCSRRKSFFVGQASGMVEPVAGVLGALLVVHIHVLLPYALAFAAGAMILAAVHELIPSCQENQAQDRYSASLGVIFGFAAMMLLDVALG